MRTPLLAWLLTLAACSLDEAKTTSDGNDSTTADSDTSSQGDTSANNGDGGDGGEDGTVDCDIGLEEGDCPPDFTLPDADGADQTLSDFRGDRVLILGTAEW